MQSHHFFGTIDGRVS